MKTIPVIFALFIILISSSRGAPPEATKSEYFITTGGGFMINGKADDRTVQYAVSVKVRKKLPPGSVLVFKFANPLDPKSPLIKEVPYKGEDEISAKSPAVWGLKPNSIYLYAALVYASKAKKTVIAAHTQKLSFGMTDEMYQKFLMPWYENHKE